MTAAQIFGTTPDGQTIRRVVLSGGGLSASIITYGASLQDLRLSGHDAPLVLGYERIEDYLDHSVYFGAIVGRYANRIAHGRFSLDGETHRLPANDRGHTLHGGPDGTWRRNWTLAEAGPDFATLRLVDPAGGFPGNLAISCIYRLLPETTLSVELSATTDAPTLCNLAHHSWFNLDDGGAGTVLDHRLQIEADAYLPVDGEGIPVGIAAAVAGTPFNFRHERRIGGSGMLYDHNFCLAGMRRPLSFAARLEGAESGISMDLWTTEPGLQFFDGAIPARVVPGLGGRRYGSHAGLCLEPQIWPDAPNRPDFPQAVLRPGEEYRQRTEFRFYRSEAVV